MYNYYYKSGADFGVCDKHKKHRRHTSSVNQHPQFSSFCNFVVWKIIFMINKMHYAYMKEEICSGYYTL